MSEGTKIELKYPIKVGGVETKTLTLRRPKVRDRLAGDIRKDWTDAEKEIHLVANLCGLTRAEIEELDLVDYQEVMGQLGNFLRPAA